MNGAGEVDVVAPLKLTKYSGSLPIEHIIITSLLVAPKSNTVVYNNEVEFEKRGRVDVRMRVNLLPEHPMVKAKKYLST